MATTKTVDETQAYDALSGVCPTCKNPVQVYLPPERAVSGPQAYPALLLHYEKSHPNATPPGPPIPNVSTGTKDHPGEAHEADSWTPPPPAPADWKPLDKARAERQLPQPEGVWPPVRSAEMPL